uniref:Syndecan n=1 Tax=Astatotilapia calliptera TaxID=8154 RepID=A0AAX7VCG2_ASTCA
KGAHALTGAPVATCSRFYTLPLSYFERALARRERERARCLVQIPLTHTGARRTSLLNRAHLYGYIHLVRFYTAEKREKEKKEVPGVRGGGIIKTQHVSGGIPLLRERERERERERSGRSWVQGKREGERRRVGKHLTFRLPQRVFNSHRGIMRNVWIIFTLGLVVFLAGETAPVPDTEDTQRTSTTSTPGSPPNPVEVHTENLFQRTEVLAAVIAGGVIGFLFAIFLILLLVYRMRKKDEGSYDLGERKPSGAAYQKAPTKEFYA